MQTSLLDLIEEGEKLKEQGMERAVTHANNVHEGWSEKAMDKLKEFMKENQGEFMCEDVRSYSALDASFPFPPSNRSWGHIFKEAEKNGLIKNLGYGITKNPKSHRTPASVWIKNNAA